MKIAIVVQGRFHAFDLTRALLKRGHEVTVLTNYPRWAAARFGLPSELVRSFVMHGILSRIAGRVQTITGWSFDSWLHPMFSRWAARQLRGESLDVIHAWTGVAEEIYAERHDKPSLKLIMRGSAHIRTQAAILEEEERRAGHRIDRPRRWMIAREQREYSLADYIIVLSTFASNSFVDEGVSASKLLCLPLGAEIRSFRPEPEVVEARRARILSGAPLRILYVGGISYRKGMVDFQHIVDKASGRFQFRCVGPVWPEAKQAARELANRGVAFISKKPQQELPSEYAWGDVFIFPTVEDGYAVVIAQASAAALPILTTTNCCGPDIVHEGRTGWVLPIRSPEAFLERLNWCDSHRDELAGMVTAAYQEFQTRDWSDVAADFEALCETQLSVIRAQKTPSHV